MEKTIESTRSRKEVVHEFYCDDCGEYLGKSEEYDDDGWYHVPNEVEVRFYLDKWYNLKKVLCDKCKAKLFDKIDKSLKELGFKSGYNEED